MRKHLRGHWSRSLTSPLLTAMLLLASHTSAPAEPTAAPTEATDSQQDIRKLMDAGWQSYEAGNLKEAEQAYRDAFAKTKGSHADAETALMDRMAALYCALGLSNREAKARLSGDEWESQELISQMALRRRLHPAKLSGITMNEASDKSKNLLEQLEAIGTEHLIAQHEPPHSVLKGYIEHSDRLNGVPAELRAGKYLTPKLKTLLLTPNNTWIRIPEWEGGSWHRSGQTTLSSTDLKTGANDNFPTVVSFSSSGYRGQQRDANGDIWELQGGTGVISRDTVYILDTEVHQEIIDSNAAQCRYKADSKRLVVSKVDDKILKSLQTQCVGITFKDGANRVVDVQSLKVFDQDGVALRLSRIITSADRTGQFRVLDKIGDKDYKQLFHEYLLSHGLAKLEK